AANAKFRVRGARESNHVVLLRHIGAGRAEVEIAREQNGLCALANDIGRAVGAKRWFGFVIELDDRDRLPENPAGSVDFRNGKFGARNRVGINRLEPATKGHDETEHRLVVSMRRYRES